MPQTVTTTGNEASEIPMVELTDGLVAFISRTSNGGLRSLVGEAVMMTVGNAAILRQGAGRHGGIIRQQNMGGTYVRLMRPGERIIIEGI